jgi:putative endonuclease
LTARSASRGRDAEQQALRHLCSQGLRLLQCNYHSRHGEIDLVMQDGDSLVFVEVRYRGHSRFGSAAESVDRRKQSRLIACAQHYLQTHPRSAGLPCRFDVITLGGNAAVDWIRDAFSA